MMSKVKLMTIMRHLAIEDISDVVESTKTQENEIVIYAKVGNLEGLEEAASKELQEQLDGKFSTGHRTRVRKTTVAEDVGYIYTFKVSNNDDSIDDVHSNAEYNIVVDSDFYEGFKNVAEKLLVKTRYNFTSKTVKITIGDGEDKEVLEIPNINYEVDVYESDMEEVWCKIDVEVDVILDYLAAHKPDIKDINLNIGISHLEFSPKDAIIDISASDDDRATINGLWEAWSKPPLVESDDT